MAAGAVFGLLLWVVNFYLISPLAFPWFAMASPLVQFLAHTFFFGAVLGALFALISIGGRRSREPIRAFPLALRLLPGPPVPG